MRHKEKEIKKAETERKRQRQRERVGHMQGMGSPTCIKRACPTKNEPQQGIYYLEREREGV
jgi:hypothetical protein